MAYKLEPEAQKAKELWQIKVPSELSRIHLKAGSRLYGSGEEGIILAIDIPDIPLPQWTWPSLTRLLSKRALCFVELKSLPKVGEL